ncbi:helix-turn-helix domain-containing protein [Latilactobacillus curvatus]
MFGQRLKAILNERNLSNYRLAKMSGVSESIINKVVSGTNEYMSFKNAVKIADALNISLDEFRK